MVQKASVGHKEILTCTVCGVVENDEMLEKEWLCER